MAKMQKYEEVLEVTIARDITVSDMVRVIENEAVLPNDYIHMLDYQESGKGNNQNATITVWRYREETDEEYQKRQEEIERVKASTRKITGILLTGISAEELIELREKAAKYDALNK